MSAVAEMIGVFQFSVGDMAVYPAQGVAEIMGIETMEISGISNQFYVLQCLDSAKTIRVPVANVAQVGLRGLVDETEINEVIGILRSEHIEVDEPNWNRRHRRYLEKIQSGRLADVARVLRDLHLLSAEKPLSYGERRVYETAQQLLVQELSIAQNTKNETVAAEVDALLS